MKEGLASGDMLDVAPRAGILNYHLPDDQVMPATHVTPKTAEKSIPEPES